MTVKGTPLFFSNSKSTFVARIERRATGTAISPGTCAPLNPGIPGPAAPGFRGAQRGLWTGLFGATRRSIRATNLLLKLLANSFTQTRGLREACAGGLTLRPARHKCAGLSIRAADDPPPGPARPEANARQRCAPSGEIAVVGNEAFGNEAMETLAFANDTLEQVNALCLKPCPTSCPAFSIG